MPTAVRFADLATTHASKGRNIIRRPHATFGFLIPISLIFRKSNNKTVDFTNQTGDLTHGKTMKNT